MLLIVFSFVFFLWSIEMPLYFRSLKEIFSFALPIIAGQLGQMLFGIGDIIVAGHYSTEVLSALGIATAIFSPYLLIGTGITFAISPLKARMLAEGEDVGSLPATSLLLALITGTILMGFIFVTGICVDHMGFDPGIGKLVSSYLMICAASIIPVMIFLVLKENLQAREKTLFANSLIIFFNLFNLVANVFFMFTCELGIEGAALATALSRTLMAVFLYIYTAKKLKFKYEISFQIMGDFYKKGIPIGLNGLLVGLIFSLVTVLVGKMSIVVSAANNILINITSFTYMVPYALASASSVKIGKEFGNRNFKKINSYALATVSLGLFSASAMGLLFLAIPEKIISIATGDAAVIDYGVTLLFYGAIYQIPDSIQVTLQGCLRGIEITFKPMIYGFSGIWAVGFPTGCFLAYGKNMGAAGLWMGMATGLSVMAFLNSFLFIKVINNFGHVRKRVCC